MNKPKEKTNAVTLVPKTASTRVNMKNLIWKSADLTLDREQSRWAER